MSHSAEKSEIRDPLGFFNIRCSKISKKIKGGAFEDFEKFSEKSLKKPEKGESQCRK